MSTALYAFGDDHAPAERLAARLGLPLHAISLHRHPDGESLPRIDEAAATAILYRALDRPDGKLMPLLLAADALRRAGATRVVLVAPYMPYLRQDTVFHPGEPLSRDVIGAVLGQAFDRVVTVEPHLHRTADLAPVFAGTEVTVLSAADLIARRLSLAAGPVVVGPDAESEPWVRHIADEIAMPHLVGSKVRRGDREVAVTFASAALVQGRRAVIVDDICSSGATLAAATQALRAAGAASVEIIVVHDLARAGAAAMLHRAGAASFLATDSIGRRANAISLAPLLAAALFPEIHR